jgi:hypothetical protein
MSAVDKEVKWCSSVAKYGKSSYGAFVKLSSFFGDKIVRLFLPRRAGWRVEDVLCKNVLELHLAHNARSQLYVVPTFFICLRNIKENARVFTMKSNVGCAAANSSRLHLNPVP